MKMMANVVGVMGILLCAASVAGRFYGEQTLHGFQAINVYTVGVGVIAAACFMRLQALK